MSIFPQVKLGSSKELLCLKYYYNALKWEIRFNLELNAARLSTL